MKTDYDFSIGKRGRYAKKAAEGTKIEIYSEKRIQEFDKAEADLAKALRQRKSGARIKPRSSVK